MNHKNKVSKSFRVKVKWDQRHPGRWDGWHSRFGGRALHILPAPHIAPTSSINSGSPDLIVLTCKITRLTSFSFYDLMLSFHETQRTTSCLYTLTVFGQKKGVEFHSGKQVSIYRGTNSKRNKSFKENDKQTRHLKVDLWRESLKTLEGKSQKIFNAKLRKQN